MAYKVGSHRHIPEIEQELSSLAATKLTLSFTPHLVPMNRGILTTIYARVTTQTDTGLLYALYREFYKNEPFVRILPAGHFPNVRNVRGSNFCDIGIIADARTGRLVAVTAIDNLVKGASGQAVQNMNLMMEFEETSGLKFAGLFP